MIRGVGRAGWDVPVRAEMDRMNVPGRSQRRTTRYPLRLSILGATGRTGVELLELGLERGHELTAFVRSPEKVPRADERIRIVKGDPRNADELAAALPGHDAVLSALGPSVGAALRHTTLLGDCATSTVSAMAKAGVGRLLVVSSALLFGGGGLAPAVFRWAIRSHLDDCAAMESVLRRSSVDWTIVRPPRLVHEADGRYRARGGGLPDDADLVHARASWRAVATFLLDAAGSRSHVCEIVGMCR